MTVGLVALAELGDSELMRRVQADDPDAFGALYDRFCPRAYRFAFGIVHDKLRAEDIVQEAFLSVWVSRSSYQPRHGAVVAWILGLVKNRAIDCARRYARHDKARGADGEHIDKFAQAPGDVEAATIERHQAAELRNLLTRLPEGQRDVITLAYFGELSATEIADTMSLPLGTVKGRMRLGLHKLRAAQDPVPAPKASSPAS